MPIKFHNPYETSSEILVGVSIEERVDKWVEVTHTPCKEVNKFIHMEVKAIQYNDHIVWNQTHNISTKNEEDCFCSLSHVNWGGWVTRRDRDFFGDGLSLLLLLASLAGRRVDVGDSVL